jgi:fumarate hydratase class I
MAVLTPHKIAAPFTEALVRDLKLGEPVLVSGTLVTARDRLHKFISEGGRLPLSLKDGALYHCGPVVARDGDRWVVRAAGPTTSSREEPYMPAIIANCGIRLIVGKGGMGPATEAACKKYGCVYLQAIGGAAQVLARAVVKVQAVHFSEEFGLTEAMWELVVRDFPAVVAIDAAGQSRYRQVAAASRQALEELIRRKPVGGVPGKGTPGE